MILGVCVLLAVLLRVVQHSSMCTGCLAWTEKHHRRCTERWNARLNAWARGKPKPKVEAQAAVRGFDDGSSDCKLGSRTSSSVGASPRPDDELTAVLIAEMRRLQQLVESRSAGATSGCAAPAQG